MRRNFFAQELFTNMITSSTMKFIKISGAYSYEETPVPIPNTVVKLIAPMILGWRRPGKAGSARLNETSRNRGLFFGGYIQYVPGFLTFFVTLRQLEILNKW